MNEPSVIRSMLNAKTIAVIGLSDRPDRPSHYVSAYLQQHGYKIYPVNPTVTEVLGEKSHPSLTALPIKPDLVDVFRVPSLIPAIVDEMLALGLKDLWVQQGIVNLEAAARAEKGGIRVVMDRCLMMEHRYAHPYGFAGMSFLCNLQPHILIETLQSNDDDHAPPLRSPQPSRRPVHLHACTCAVERGR